MPRAPVPECVQRMQVRRPSRWNSAQVSSSIARAMPLFAVIRADGELLDVPLVGVRQVERDHDTDELVTGVREGRGVRAGSSTAPRSAGPIRRTTSAAAGSRRTRPRSARGHPRACVSLYGVSVNPSGRSRSTVGSSGRSSNQLVASTSYPRDRSRTVPALSWSSTACASQSLPTSRDRCLGPVEQRRPDPEPAVRRMHVDLRAFAQMHPGPAGQLTVSVRGRRSVSCSRSQLGRRRSAATWSGDRLGPPVPLDLGCRDRAGRSRRASSTVAGRLENPGGTMPRSSRTAAGIRGVLHVVAIRPGCRRPRLRLPRG